MHPIKSWLARLSFSFLILSVLLAWQVYRNYGQTGLSGSAIAQIIGAILAIVLFLLGTKYRHQG